MHRGISIYLLLAIAIGIFLSNFILYFYARSNSPRQPDFSTGHVYPQQMKQPFVVYLTGKQELWLDYSLPIAVIVFITGAFLNNKWEIIQNHNGKTPELTRQNLNTRK